jgi:hypothetical protein
MAPHGPHHATKLLSRAPNWPPCCSSNLTKKIAFSLRSVQNSLLLHSTCLTAGCAWTRFQKIVSHGSIPADTLFAGNAFVRSSCRRLSRAASRFCVQHAPRRGVAARKTPEVSLIAPVTAVLDCFDRRGDARAGTRYRNHRGALRDLG